MELKETQNNNQIIIYKLLRKIMQNFNKLKIPRPSVFRDFLCDPFQIRSSCLSTYNKIYLKIFSKPSSIAGKLKLKILSCNRENLYLPDPTGAEEIYQLN